MLQMKSVTRYTGSSSSFVMNDNCLIQYPNLIQYMQIEKKSFQKGILVCELDAILTLLEYSKIPVLYSLHFDLQRIHNCLWI
ncbi:Hypothetical predicted protein [Octopus vulgaris]|uniref:Uncharacterized protein n=1 Tax=Octopus vulgaris TaxID=6645 RepID=A0AA36BQC1_OCTVU|nr:Hypothetical predicted protein [Octopus vulgaris]